MGQRMSSYLYRHRRKFFVAGSVVGGLALLNKYVRNRCIEWEKKRTMEYFEKLKRQNHFDGTLKTCDSAILSFVDKIRSVICNTLEVKVLVEELKQKPPNKVELWQELNVMVFSQAVTEVYANCLLVVLLRVQISILGGYIYSDFRKNDSHVSSLGSENQQKYLSHITNFFISGIVTLTIPVEEAVRKAFRNIKLSDLLKLSDFHKIFRDVGDYMSQGRPEPIPNVEQYLMLPDFKDANENESYNDFMKKIVNETKDVLECGDFNRVLSSSLEQGVALLMDRVSECYMHLSNDSTGFMNPHNIAVPLARIIPIMHSVFDSHKPSEQGALVHSLLQQDTLTTFAANLYEAFSQES